MKSLWVIILLTFIASNAFSLTLERAKEFLKALESSDFCSIDFYENFKNTELSDLAISLFIDSCFSKKEYERISKIKENPKEYYFLIEKAYALKKVGKEKEAKRLFKIVFSKTNRFDEWILILNAGDTKYLFTPKILRRKVWKALSERNFDIAEVYLSLLENDPYFYLLKGIFYLKQRKYNLARKELRKSERPEKYFYLTFIARSSAERFYYYQKAISSNISSYSKKRLTVYILDKFLYQDKGFFRKALNLARKVDKKLYKEYLVKYFVLTGNIDKALKVLRTLQGEKYRAWEVVLHNKFLGIEKSFSSNTVSFYSVLLNRKKPAVFKGAFPKKEDVSDEGIRFLLERGRCDILEFVNGKSPSIALAHYFCGKYKRAIKEAFPFKKKQKKYPFLLYVLYPKPEVFGNDLISLSLARQESLFDELALSRSGAMGLMQIMPFTGKYIAKKLKVEDFKVSQLLDPEVNYRFGSFYINELIKQFSLFPLAAASYNAGPTRIKRALKLFGKVEDAYDLVIFTDFYIPFEETRNYVKKVLTNYYYYSQLYGEEIDNLNTGVIKISSPSVKVETSPSFESSRTAKK